MTAVTEVLDIELNGWVGGTRLFRADDGQHFVVCAATAEDLRDGKQSVVRQPTVILYTNGKGRADDLAADFTFDPGTSHEDAIVAAGFTLGGGDA